RFARTAGAIEGFSGIPNSSLLQDDKFVIENRRLNVNGDEDFAAHANCGVPLQVLASRAEDDAKKIAVGRRFVWSGRPDLNRRPHAPQACALPGCATPRPETPCATAATTDLVETVPPMAPARQASTPV